MRVSDVDFQFPVLGFTRDHDAWGFSDIGTLTSCGRSTLKDNIQIGMELIDSGGQRWIVRTVRRIGRAQSLPMWLVCHVLSMPQSRIEQDLEPLDSVSLDDVKARMTRAILAYPDYWADSGDADANDPEIQTRLKDIAGAESIARFFDLFGLDSFMAY